jgi:hypothetical protein
VSWKGRKNKKLRAFPRHRFGHNSLRLINDKRRENGNAERTLLFVFSSTFVRIVNDFHHEHGWTIFATRVDPKIIFTFTMNEIIFKKVKAKH